MIPATNATTIRTVDLGYEQMLMITGRPGTRVKVIYGGVWLTEEGRTQDVFARGGEAVAVQSHRRALLEGLGPTRVELIEPVKAGPWRAVVGNIAAAAAQAALVIRGATLRSARVMRTTLAVFGLLVGVAVPTLIAVGITATAETSIQPA